MLAAVNNEGFCYIWDTHEGECAARLMIEAHPKAYALKCTFSPDGRWVGAVGLDCPIEFTFFSSLFGFRWLVTTSSDSTARVWNVQNNFEQAAILHRHSMWVWDCAFSGDSAFLVTGELRNACMWNP